MALYTTKGIVFRSMKYKESSLIVDIFTEEKGLRSYIISGVRSAKSKMKANLLQLMNIVELTAYDGDPDKLTRIKDVTISEPYKTLPYDVIRASLGTFMIEGTRNALKDKEPDQEIYQFITSHFIKLDRGVHMKFFHLKYLLDLSHYFGFYPMMNWSEENSIFNLQEGSFSPKSLSHTHCLDSSSSSYIYQLMVSSADELPHLPITSKERDEILDNILRYFEYHLGHFRQLKSLDILKVVLS